MRDGHLYQMEVSFSRIKAGRLPISRPDLPAPLRSDLEHQSWFQTNQWNSHELHRIFVRKRKIHQLDVLECYFLSFFFAVFFLLLSSCFWIKDINIYFRPIRSQWSKLRFRQELTLRLTASFLDRAETGDVTATLGPKAGGGVFFGGCCWWKKSQTTT